jgi:hypothetical protein
MQQLPPGIPHGWIDIDEHRVERFPPCNGSDGRVVLHREHLPATLTDDICHQLKERWVVIHNGDTGHVGSPPCDRRSHTEPYSSTE